MWFMTADSYAWWCKLKMYLRFILITFYMYGCMLPLNCSIYIIVWFIAMMVVAQVVYYMKRSEIVTAVVAVVL